MEMRTRFDSDGRPIPVYDECFAGIRSCQNLLAYCPDLALKRFMVVPTKGLRRLR